MRIRLVVVVCALLPWPAYAQTRDDAPESDRAARHDPTGGAFTPPTSLFTPAAALPPLVARVTTGVDVQPAGRFAAVRPLLAAELGLGRGFTLAAGTAWVGGDAGSFADGLSPYGQVRWQVFGPANGPGLYGGASLGVKRVGYRGGEGEVEASFSLHHRAARYELGVQGTFGQSFEEIGEHDLEFRAFAAWRVVPSLALGLSAQVRGDVGQEGEAAARRAMGRGELDLLGGATVSYTRDRWQVGTLVGVSTLGLANTVAFASQVYGAVRF